MWLWDGWPASDPLIHDGCPGSRAFRDPGFDATAHLLYNREEPIASGGEQRLRPITTAGDEMQVTAAVVACESAGTG